jgi:hypothetical protein
MDRRHPRRADAADSRSSKRNGRSWRAEEQSAGTRRMRPTPRTNAIGTAAPRGPPLRRGVVTCFRPTASESLSTCFQPGRRREQKPNCLLMNYLVLRTCWLAWVEGNKQQGNPPAGAASRSVWLAVVDSTKTNDAVRVTSCAKDFTRLTIYESRNLTPVVIRSKSVPLSRSPQPTARRVFQAVNEDSDGVTV